MSKEVRSWNNAVCIISYGSTDGYHTGTVWFASQEEWEHIKEKVDAQWQKIKKEEIK